MDMTIEDQIELVNMLCAIDSGLNDWEMKFVDGIAKQVLDRKQTLSSTQLKKALEILSIQEGA